MRSITEVNPSSEVLIDLLEELNSLEDDTRVGVCFSLVDYTWGKSLKVNLGTLWDSENDEREQLTDREYEEDDYECLVSYVRSGLLELSAHLNQLATVLVAVESKPPEESILCK